MFHHSLRIDILNGQQLLLLLLLWVCVLIDFHLLA